VFGHYLKECQHGAGCTSGQRAGSRIGRMVRAGTKIPSWIHPLGRPAGAGPCRVKRMGVTACSKFAPATSGQLKFSLIKLKVWLYEKTAQPGTSVPVSGVSSLWS
jgi:hypothetical protein